MKSSSGHGSGTTPPLGAEAGAAPSFLAFSPPNHRCARHPWNSEPRTGLAQFADDLQRNLQQGPRGLRIRFETAGRGSPAPRGGVKPPPGAASAYAPHARRLQLLWALAILSLLAGEWSGRLLQPGSNRRRSACCRRRFPCGRHLPPARPRPHALPTSCPCALAAGGAAAACTPVHNAALGRRLLQGDVAAPAAAAAASPASAPADGSTIIVDEVVDQSELAVAGLLCASAQMLPGCTAASGWRRPGCRHAPQLLAQPHVRRPPPRRRPPAAECSMMHRALVAGDVLRPGAANLQSDETACCRSCLADDRCTAWVYCPDPAGCNATEAAAAAAAASGDAAAAAPVRRDGASSPAPAPAAEDEAEGRSLYLPHRGCRLLSIPAFRLRKDSPQVVAKGPGVPYISGGCSSSRPPQQSLLRHWGQYVCAGGGPGRQALPTRLPLAWLRRPCSTAAPLLQARP